MSPEELVRIRIDVLHLAERLCQGDPSRVVALASQFERYVTAGDIADAGENS
jgi:hypothetical protein